MYCTKCRKDKDVSEFRERKSLKRGYHSWCKECEKIASKKRYKPKPKKKRQPYNKHKALIRMLKYRYNLTYDEYVELYNKQNGKCAICKTSKQLGSNSGLLVDHCHKTNKVRGLLCNNCNSGIGKLQDDINILYSAIKYLSSI